MKTKLNKNKRYQFILTEMKKHYGLEKVNIIEQRSIYYYDQMEKLCAGATNGERMHLEKTILPIISIYKAVLEIDDDNALMYVHDAFMLYCSNAAKVLDKILKMPGMTKIFIKLFPKILHKVFGPASGFGYQQFTADETGICMNIVMCPYCRYTNLLA